MEVRCWLFFDLEELPCLLVASTLITLAASLGKEALLGRGWASGRNAVDLEP
jgi:hypothetical protein